MGPLRWIGRKGLKLGRSKLTWLFLLRMHRSFFSKATVSLSVSLLVLANLEAPLRALGFNLLPSIYSAFFGSIFYIVGYLVTLLRAPVEFRGSFEIDEIAIKFLQMNTYSMFTSRLGMSRKLLAEFETDTPADLPEGELRVLREDIARASQCNEQNWGIRAVDLYTTELSARNFLNPNSRLCAGLCTGIGVTLLLAPTALSLGQVLYRVLSY